MLHSMIIRLIYVHLLEPFNLCQMPTRGDLGPNLDFHVNCNIFFVLIYKIFRQDLCRFNDTTALVSSSFCQHVNISYMLRSILTKLGLNDQYLDRYSHNNNGGVKGHDGVTGVKKVIFTKIGIFRTDYMVWSCDSYMFIS